MGPPGVNAPAAVPMMSPRTPEPSPIHWEIRSVGRMTWIRPATAKAKIIFGSVFIRSWPPLDRPATARGTP